MKKILFALLLSLVLIPGVKADTSISLEEFTQEECSSTHLNYSYYYFPNEYTTGVLYYNTEDNSLYHTSSGMHYKKYILLNSDTTYNVRTNSQTTIKLIFFDTKFNYLSSLDINSNVTVDSFTTPTSSNGYLYMFYSLTLVRDTNIFFYKDVEPSPWYEQSFVTYECPTIEAPVEPEEPDIPVEPEEPVVADTTLDNFYSTFNSKLQSLTEYATENKFILGAISIIILFVVLEIVIHLSKGGYR